MKSSLFGRNAARQSRRAGLGPADQPLDLEQILANPAGPASSSAETSARARLTLFRLLLVDAETVG